MTRYKSTTLGNGVQVSSISRAKKQSRRLAYLLYLQSLDPAYPDRLLPVAYRVRDCSSHWWGWRCPDCGGLHHMTTYGCHHRLCPVCAVRKSRAVAAQAVTVMEGLEGQPINYALLTLTQRNVAAADLSAEIDRILSAWSSLRLIRAVRRDLLGWARTIEITVSADGTYHPHVHCILLVRQGAANLLSAAYWRSLWRAALALDYDPVCDCRAITDINAVYEVAKYVTKIGRLLDTPCDGHVYDDVTAITGAIYKRRLRSYGGIWASARRKMRMVDVDALDDGSLDELGGALDRTDPCCARPLVPIALIWAGHDYIIKEDCSK